MSSLHRVASVLLVSLAVVLGASRAAHAQVARAPSHAGSASVLAVGSLLPGAPRGTGLLHRGLLAQAVTPAGGAAGSSVVVVNTGASGAVVRDSAEDRELRGARVTSALTVPRAIVAPLFGALFGGALGAAGSLIGLVSGCVSGATSMSMDAGMTVGNTVGGCTIGLFAGLYTGILIGVPIGQVIGGAIFAGRGSFWAALAGTAIGTVVSVPTAFVLSAVALGQAVSGSDASGTAIAIAASLGLLPVIGGMIGYELSSAAAVRRVVERHRVARAVPMPSAAPIFAEGRVVGGQVSVAMTSF